jgi:hypothetical protein
MPEDAGRAERQQYIVNSLASRLFAAPDGLASIFKNDGSHTVEKAVGQQRPASR